MGRATPEYRDTGKPKVKFTAVQADRARSETLALEVCTRRPSQRVSSPPRA
jgi:hypothetical protein